MGMSVDVLINDRTEAQLHNIMKESAQQGERRGVAVYDCTAPIEAVWSRG
jgi:hypothetical protein